MFMEYAISSVLLKVMVAITFIALNYRVANRKALALQRPKQILKKL
jgi:hypothetical protein